MERKSQLENLRDSKISAIGWVTLHSQVSLQRRTPSDFFSIFLLIGIRPRNVPLIAEFCSFHFWSFSFFAVLPKFLMAPLGLIPTKAHSPSPSAHVVTHLILLLLCVSFVAGQNSCSWYGRAGSLPVIRVDPSGHSGNFTTVQSAIDSVPENNQHWVCIYVKEGIYRWVGFRLMLSARVSRRDDDGLRCACKAIESRVCFSAFFTCREKVQIPLNKPFILLKGRGKRKTEIVWNDHETIAQSPTFTSLADNIIVKSMSFRVSDWSSGVLYLLILASDVVFLLIRDDKCTPGFGRWCSRGSRTRTTTRSTRTRGPRRWRRWSPATSPTSTGSGFGGCRTHCGTCKAGITSSVARFKGRSISSLGVASPFTRFDWGFDHGLVLEIID